MEITNLFDHGSSEDVILFMTLLGIINHAICLTSVAGRRIVKFAQGNFISDTPNANVKESVRTFDATGGVRAASYAFLNGANTANDSTADIASIVAAVL